MTIISHRTNGHLVHTDLVRLNSLTKYPSILTYHALGERGALTPDILVPFPVDEEISITEKVDGTNARIVFFGAQYGRTDHLIGSREDILFAKGDRIGNPAMGIVAELEEAAFRLTPFVNPDGSLDGIVVVFGEVYGGNIGGNAKQYTGTRATGFRIFDVISMTGDTAEELLAQPPARIAAWRDGGGQGFVSERSLNAFCAETGLDRAPVITYQYGRDLPTGLQDTYAWMKNLLPATCVALDTEAGRRPEGLVIRTANRQHIAKIRYEDYERTARHKR